MWFFNLFKSREEWVLLDIKYGPWRKETALLDGKVLIESQSKVSFWYLPQTGKYKINFSGCSQPCIIGTVPTCYRSDNKNVLKYIHHELKVGLCDVLRYSDY